MKAVIIDDEKRTRELIAKLIESFDLGIETFPIGESVTTGLKAIESIHPDIIFLDNNLPDGLGWDKLPELYQKYPDIQFHLISAFRPTMPSELDGAKLTIWEKPISLKSLDNFF